MHTCVYLVYLFQTVTPHYRGTVKKCVAVNMAGSLSQLQNSWSYIDIRPEILLFLDEEPDRMRFTG